MTTQALTTTSQIIGWIYFVSWSISFYGQIYVNYKLKSVRGFKLDFAALNLVGFTFYSLYTSEGYYNPNNNYGLGEVEIQDLLFAYHALVMVIITCIQCMIYERGDNTVSLPARILVVTYVVAATLFYFVTKAEGWTSSDFNWFLLLGYMKLSISTIKYTPQVYWNYLRKSTFGWSIFNILCDFCGGFFSIAQTVVDTINGGGSDFNVIKFSLGNISMVFDVVFMIQHYVIYKNSNLKVEMDASLLFKSDIENKKPYMNGSHDSMSSNGSRKKNPNKSNGNGNKLNMKDILPEY